MHIDLLARSLIEIAMKITHAQLTAFVAVGREKSFSKGAKSLGLGQSAITQHIGGLEETIGNKLFVRNRSGTQLTVIGQELYLMADQICVLEEQFYERAAQYTHLDAGSLSICVSTPRPAMAVISAYTKRYPGVDVSLQLAPWKQAINMIQKREVDIGIIMLPENLENLHILEIDAQPFVAILPKEHSLAEKKVIDIADFQHETLIMLSHDSYTRHCVNQVLSDHQIAPKKTLTTTSYEMMLEATIHQMGVSIALEGAQGGYEHSITTVPIRQFKNQHAYAVTCSKDKASLLIIKSFYEVAKEFNTLK